MTLLKRDCQLFFKRLRKSTPGVMWRYYLAGEYGSLNMRPHYHIILFTNAKYDKNQLLVLLHKAWDRGLIDVGSVSGASIAYTLKYVCKPTRIPMFDRDDRVPEFSLTSKKLGVSFLTPAIRQYYANNLTENYVIQDGFKVAMPKYYRDKILSQDEKLRQRRIISLAEKSRKATQFDNYIRLHRFATQFDYEQMLTETHFNHQRLFYEKAKNSRKL